jgi:hypothetical protein
MIDGDAIGVLFRYIRVNTLAEIEVAVMALPVHEQKALLELLAHRLERRAPMKRRRGLKADARPALEGLPSDLSVGTRERVRDLVARRHAANC